MVITLKCPLTDDWMKKCGTYIQWNEHYSAIKDATTCMDLENMTLAKYVKQKNLRTI